MWSTGTASLASGEKNHIWKTKKIYYLSFLSSLMIYICNPSPSTGEAEAGEQGCIRWIQGRKYALFLGQWWDLGMQFRGERAPHMWDPPHPIICATNSTFNSFKKQNEAMWCWVWWLLPVILGLIRLRQKDCHKFKNSLGYRMRHSASETNKSGLLNI